MPGIVSVMIEYTVITINDHDDDDGDDDDYDADDDDADDDDPDADLNADEDDDDDDDDGDDGDDDERSALQTAARPPKWSTLEDLWPPTNYKYEYADNKIIITNPPIIMIDDPSGRPV